MRNLNIIMLNYIKMPDNTYDTSFNDYKDIYDISCSDNNDFTPAEGRQELINFVNKLSEANSEKMMELVQLFFSNSDNEIFDMKNIKDKYEFREEQDKSNLITFLHNYLFLIIKIIFFITLFILLFLRIRNNNLKNNLDIQSVNKNIR